jgi:Reverse transcriptase (RNA-dependent DNA polymerase)
LESMLATGRIVQLGPEEVPPMETALVLVPEGQTGQAFRICQNLIPLNKRTAELQLPCGDTRRILTRMGRRKYASLIDLKAGYHNVPFDAATTPLATFVTHRGKYRWARMPFGLTNAPAHFQWCMEQIVNDK